MPGRNYERMEITPFGEHLLSTGDLDPVYIALTRMDGDPDLLRRWLVGYWCTYHCGLASWLAEKEGKSFWNGLRTATANVDPAPTGGRYPRGSERRYWRGAVAVRASDALAGSYRRPEDMVNYIVGSGGNYVEVAKRAQEHYLFGPWMSFKICDMTDRVLEIPVDFSQAAVFMFKDPVKAALMLWRKRQKLLDNAEPKDMNKVINMVVEYLLDEFKGWKAPPKGDRPVNIQEIETILCKWKSHMNGHYPKYNDIDEITEGMQEWLPHSEVAAQFLKHLPRKGEQDAEST